MMLHNIFKVKIRTMNKLLHLTYSIVFVGEGGGHSIHITL